MGIATERVKYRHTREYLVVVVRKKPAAAYFDQAVLIWREDDTCGNVNKSLVMPYGAD